MKKLFCIVLSVFMFFLFSHTGEANEGLDELNHISDMAWQLSKQNRFEETAQLLTYFDQKFEELAFFQEEFTTDQLKTIYSTKEKAYEKVLDETIPTEERVKAVTQFRLVVDALSSEHQPLWGTMEEPIMTTFSNLKENIESGDYDSFEEEWGHFRFLYSMIYPSLTIDANEQHIKRVETHISAIESNLYENMTEHTKFEQLVAIEEALEDLFHQAEQDDADPSLLWVMISTGSIIFLALSYAGWRKYRGEVSKLPSKQNSKHY